MGIRGIIRLAIIGVSMKLSEQNTLVSLNCMRILCDISYI